MSAPEISPDSPAAERLFDVHRRTWEIELLISGAVVFTLLRVPGWLDRAFERTEMHLSAELFWFPYLAYYGLKAVSYVLIVAFVSHLVTRAYWIGLIGLEAVFPDGIDWRRVDFGPRTKAFYRRRLPSIQELVRTVDRIGSSIFSASFFFVLLFVYTGLLAVLLALPALVIDHFLFAGKRLPAVAFGLFFLFFLPPSIATGLDKLAASRSYSWGRSRRFRAFVDRTLACFYWLSPSHLTSPIQFTFFSRLPKKVLYPLMYTILLGMSVVFSIGILVRAGAVRFDSYVYFHDEMGELGVDPKLYESQRRPGEIYRITPVIQSDVVTGPYVRLFLPYSPRHHNDDLARACPDLEPLREEGLSLRSREVPDPRALARARECLAAIYELWLDGERLLDLEPQLHRHPETDARGLLVYLPTAPLAPGRHLLEVRRLHHDEDLPENRRSYSIPFWL